MIIMTTAIAPPKTDSTFIIVAMVSLSDLDAGAGLHVVLPAAPQAPHWIWAFALVGLVQSIAAALTNAGAITRLLKIATMKVSLSIKFFISNPTV